MSKSKSMFDANRGAEPQVKHVSELQKEVLDYLRDNRGFKSVTEISEALNFNKGSQVQVFTALKNNPKVLWSDDSSTATDITLGILRYKAFFDQINNLEQLKDFIKLNPDGLRIEQLEDAYPGVKEDIQNLVDEKFVYKLSDPKEKRGDNIYYRDRAFEREVSADLKDMWRKIEIPTDGNSVIESAVVLISF
jgi:hypothetical protein